MIEEVIKKYLELYLDVPVYIEIPADPAEQYVFIEKTAGGGKFLKNATLAIQSVSEISLYKASELNEKIKNVLMNIANETAIMSCELNTDYNYTDKVTKKYRYQAVFLFYFY